MNTSETIRLMQERDVLLALKKNRPKINLRNLFLEMETHPETIHKILKTLSNKYVTITRTPGKFENANLDKYIIRITKEGLSRLSKIQEILK